MTDAQRAQKAKFQLQLMLLMINCGRAEEAQKAYLECESLLDQIIVTFTPEEDHTKGIFK